MASKTTQKKTKKPINKTLDMVIKDFNASWEYTSGSWHDRWERNHFLYNGERTSRAYDGIADYFVPMTFSTVETIVSALFGSKPSYDYIPTSKDEDEETDVLNALSDSYWEKDQWTLKNIELGRSYAKLGVGIAYYSWDRDRICKQIIPLRDFFIDPTATSIETARYVGRRYLTTKEDLESFEVIDLDAKPDKDGNYPMKKKYSNLDGLEGAETNENTDQEEKNLWYGSTIAANAKKKQIEVIEYWTTDRVITVANRIKVIEDTENYYKTKARDNGDEYARGILPFADARDYTDESLFYAKGEVDIIADQQEELNDLTNQYIDAITFQLNPMFNIPMEHADKIEEVESLPGAVYPYDIRPINTGTTSTAAFSERINIKNEIRETTATNEMVRGGSTGSANPTATEISAQIAGASQRLTLKVAQLENGFFFKEAKIVLAMIRLYVTEKTMVRVVGKEGVDWKEFDPEMLKRDYDPRVQLDISVQAQKQREAENAKELVAAFLNDPDIDQIELKRLALKRGFQLDLDEVDELIVKPEQPELENMQLETQQAQTLELPPEIMAMIGGAGSIPQDMAMTQQTPIDAQNMPQMPVQAPQGMM